MITVQIVDLLVVSNSVLFRFFHCDRRRRVVYYCRDHFLVRPSVRVVRDGMFCTV